MICVTTGTLLLGGGCSTRRPARSLSPDAELIIRSGKTNRTFHLRDIHPKLAKTHIVVDDPVYQRKKRFEGFWLEDVLRHVGVELVPESVIIFSSFDGYQARVPATLIAERKPVLAFRDLDSTNGWELFERGKEKTTPAPFYLVWHRLPDLDRLNAKNPDLAWPYQITQIEHRNVSDSRSRLLPKPEAGENVFNGYNLFVTSCLQCHSVNLEGGALGPELNVPKNITEYREWSYLIDFVRDPSSFRAKSRMPSFGSLSSNQIDDILNYLWSMRDNKNLEPH